MANINNKIVGAEALFKKRPWMQHEMLPIVFSWLTEVALEFRPDTNIFPTEELLKAYHSVIWFLKDTNLHCDRNTIQLLSVNCLAFHCKASGGGYWGFDEKQHPESFSVATIAEVCDYAYSESLVGRHQWCMFGFCEYNIFNMYPRELNWMLSTKERTEKCKIFILDPKKEEDHYSIMNKLFLPIMDQVNLVSTPNDQYTITEVKEEPIPLIDTSS